MPKPDLRAEIRARALMEGFDVVRFTPANAAAHAGENLQAFLSQERHGNMDWMLKNADRRADPKTLWPDAKTAIVLGMNYGPRAGYHDAPVADDRAAISVYAQGDDYHDVMKPKLKRLASFIAETYGAGVKVFVDTAPVM